MKIANDCVVGIHYSLKSPKGELIDSSEGQDPLVFLFGRGALVPGMEKALADKAVGDKFNLVITPEEGYGVRDENLVQTVEKDKFQGVDNIEEGMFLEVDTEVGPMIVVVTAIAGNDITLDGNHPLAGQELHFDVEVVEVRDASAEELEHGHAHGPGGHHH